MVEQQSALAVPQSAPRRDAGDVAALGLVLLALVGVPWTLWAADPSDRVPFADVAAIPAACVACWLLWRAARAPHDARTTRALVLVALAHVAGLLTDVLWTTAELVPGLSTGPAIAASAAYYLLLLWGAFSFPARQDRNRRVFWLDVATVALGVGLPLAYASQEAGAAGGGVFAAYALGDAVLLLAFAALSQGGNARQRPGLQWLSLGLLFMLAGDVLYGLARPRGAGNEGGLAGALLLLSWVGVGLAGRSFAGSGRGPETSAPEEQPVSLVPFASIAVGYGALLLAALRGRPAVGMVVAAALLTGFVLLRQVESARENARLVREQTALRDKVRFETLVESAADVLALVDAEARFKYLSPPVKAVLGRSPEELVGVNAFELIHPEDVAGARRALASALEKPGVLQQARFRFRHADGSWRDIDAEGINHLDRPEIAAISATFRDVTERRRAEEELRGQKELLANLLAVARATAASPRLEQTLRNALGAIRRVVGAEGGSIFLLDERGVVRSSLFAGGEPMPEEVRTAHAARVLRDGLAGWVARHRETAVVDDVDRDPRWVSMASETVRSALSVPVRAGEALVAVLTLVDSRPAFFGAGEARFVQGACEQLALALHNAQVFDSLGRMAHRLRLLNEFVKAAGLRLDPDAMIDAALATITSRTHWVNVALSIPDADGLYLRIRALPLGQAPGRPQRVDEGIAGRAFKSGRTQLVPDVARDPDYLAASPEVRSELAVPLVRAGRVLGVLNLESEELDGFDEEDLLLAEALADTIALAVDDALTYRRLADESERLQAVIRASRDGILLLDADGRIQLVNPPALRLLGLEGEPEAWLGRGPADAPRLAELPTREGEHAWGSLAVRSLSQPVSAGGAEGSLVVLRDVSEELRVAQLREDLTHTLVHDLRSPLNSIVGFLEILGQASFIEGSHRELLEIAGRATERLVALVDTVLDVARLEKGVLPVARERVPVAPLVAEVLDMQKPVSRQRGIALRAAVDAGLPSLDADPGLLRRVVENLVANAIRHTPRGGEVSVSAAASADGASVELRVADTGRGIPVEDQLRIFEKYATGSQKERGSGLGLAFCRLVVEAHGGRIRVESEPEKGATFAFSLPAARGLA